ncbi:MAG: hypothetical protein GTO18_19160 [Anaerolineales bacterium]|nr:hypothetical protein [Anaerolineales bacterium]
MSVVTDYLKYGPTPSMIGGNNGLRQMVRMDAPMGRPYDLFLMDICL